jgi:hypothetical protein
VRLIRNANLPDRKLFLHSDSLYDWLAEVLTWNERVRLMTFLSEGQTQWPQVPDHHRAVEP